MSRFLPCTKIIYFPTICAFDSVDFNSETMNYQAMSPATTGNIFDYNLFFNFNQQTYYRKNQKIFDLFANAGGTINFFFLLGKFICGFYNFLLYKYLLTKNLFCEQENKMDSK